MSVRHVDAAELAAWVDGRADGIVAMSVEEHVARCGACQGSVAQLAYPGGELAVDVAPVDLDAVWSAVRDEVELPRPSWLERALLRAGLPPGDAVLAGAAPALRGSWLCALTLAVLFALGGATSARSGGLLLFLTLAPLAPVLGVAVAFGPEGGSGLEQESAAPYPLVRLVLLRSAAVLLAALPVVILGQQLFPERLDWRWLLPAAGFTALVLALSPWFGPWRPAVAIALVWSFCTTLAERWGTVAGVLDGRCLILYILMLVLGPVVLVLRARRVGTIGRISS